MLVKSFWDIGYVENQLFAQGSPDWEGKRTSIFWREMVKMCWNWVRHDMTLHQIGSASHVFHPWQSDDTDGSVSAKWSRCSVPHLPQAWAEWRRAFCPLSYVQWWPPNPPTWCISTPTWVGLEVRFLWTCSFLGYKWLYSNDFPRDMPRAECAISWLALWARMKGRISAWNCMLSDMRSSKTAIGMLDFGGQRQAFATIFLQQCRAIRIDFWSSHMGSFGALGYRWSWPVRHITGADNHEWVV